MKINLVGKKRVPIPKSKWYQKEYSIIQIKFQIYLHCLKVVVYILFNTSSINLYRVREKKARFQKLRARLKYLNTSKYIFEKLNVF